MIQYLVAAFFSILGNCICVYFVNHGFIVLKNGQSIMDVYFHTNCINLLSFTILFWIQKAQGKVKFRAIDTFRGKKEMVQFLLFFFPVVASCYKTYMLDFVPVTTITISSMIIPFTVWLLATFLLREVFRKAYIKYSILSLIGFVIVNASKLSNGQWSFGYIKYLLIYVMLMSVGQITSRYYCRKRDHALQAVMAEIFIFFIYGSCFMIARGTFSIDLLKNPFVIIVSLCSFVRNVLIVNGVRHASSVVALEFCGFSKPIFSFIIMFFLVGEVPTVQKVIGMVIIGIAIVRFHALERKYKAERKAIGKKLFNPEIVKEVQKANEEADEVTKKKVK